MSSNTRIPSSSEDANFTSAYEVSSPLNIVSFKNVTNINSNLSLAFNVNLNGIFFFFESSIS
jgi:hypothetical protein